jgi:hypothetical protein
LTFGCFCGGVALEKPLQSAHVSWNVENKIAGQEGEIKENRKRRFSKKPSNSSMYEVHLPMLYFRRFIQNTFIQRE